MIQIRSAVPRYLLVAAALSVGVLSGCSGSSSGGASTTTTTAKADRSETFHNVTPRANHILQRSLALMRGVASDTYQGTDLMVKFRSTALKVDQTNVENVVKQARAKAASQKSTHKKSKR
jgi:hypothetical protein